MTKPRLSYQTVEFGKIDIHLCTLRNRQEFHDPVGVAEVLGYPLLSGRFSVLCGHQVRFLLTTIATTTRAQNESWRSAVAWR